MHSEYALERDGRVGEYGLEHVIIGACVCSCGDCADPATGLCVCILCACRNDETKQEYAFRGIA